MSTFGARVKKLRVKKNYEIDKLAHKANIDADKVAAIEEGQEIDLDVRAVINLAEILDADLDYLLLGNLENEEDDEDVEKEIAEDEFLKQIVTDKIIQYMQDYPITYWANLFRKMHKKKISPDGICKLLDAVETVKPEENGNHAIKINSNNSRNGNKITKTKE